MTPGHLNPDLVEQYVIGALDAESTRFVEAHVAQCPACAVLLRDEARVEVALHEVAAASVAQRKVVPLFKRRRVGVGVGVLAVAAAAALVVVLRSGVPDEAPRVRDCSNPGTARECISKAQFDGVLTIGPRGEPIVPRYDVTGGAP